MKRTRRKRVFHAAQTDRCLERWRVGNARTTAAAAGRRESEIGNGLTDTRAAEMIKPLGSNAVTPFSHVINGTRVKEI